MPQTIFDDPDGTLGMLRDSVAALAQRQPGPASLRAVRAEARDTDPALWASMAEAGWLGLLLPEDLGGAGLGLAEQAVLSEALGRALICEPFVTNVVIPSALLRLANASAARDRLASGLADGSLRISTAWQSAQARPLEAVIYAGGVELSGAARFVDAADAADVFLVVAEAAGNVVLLEVPAGTSGREIEGHRSVEGTRISDVRFAKCQLPADAVLMRGASVAALMDEPIAMARIAMAAELAGIASAAVERTIAYTKDRVQFGKPIASFQVVQHRLVDMWSDAEFACSAVVNAVQRQAEGGTEARKAILAAKARAGDAATSICRRAVHLHGAMGFTDEHDIGLYLKRAVALAATLGQSEALRLEFIALERAA